MILQNCQKINEYNTCVSNNNNNVVESEGEYFNKSEYFKNKNILNCDKNNLSRTCPVLLCNYEKQRTMNNNISKRNFPENDQKIVMDYRPGFNVCMSRYNYKNYNDNLKKNVSSKKVSPQEMVNMKSELVPGKAHVKKYFENIDVDSELKNIFELNKKCSRNFPYNQKLERNIEYVGCVAFKNNPKSALKCNCYRCHQNHNYPLFTNCSTAPCECPPPDRGAQDEYKPRIQSWGNAATVNMIPPSFAKEIPSCVCNKIIR